MIFVIVDYADMLTKNLKLSVPVAQYCNIAIGGHGHWDAHGLSAIDLSPRLMMLTYTVRSRAWGLYMSVWGQQYLRTRVAVVFG